MNNTDQKIELYFKLNVYQFYCNFNSKGEFILYGTDQYWDEVNILWVYSTQGNKWMCQKLYMTPLIVGTAELISISKYDKIWLRYNNYIYEWNVLANNTTIISKNVYGVIINIFKFHL